MKTKSGIYLLNETIEVSDAKVVGKNNNGFNTIETVLQVGDVLNRNGRKYNTADLIANTKADRTRELIEARSLFGEAGHPLTNDIRRQGTIDPKLISHNIIDLWNEGNVIMGKVVPVDNEFGRTFNNLINEGSKLAFSARSIGVIEKVNGVNVVKRPTLITYDWVIFPSYKEAYMTRTLNESSNISLSESGLVFTSDRDSVGNKLILDSKHYDGAVFIEHVSPAVKEMIMNESKNINDVLEQIELDESSMTVSRDGKHVIFNSGSGAGKFSVELESMVLDGILDYYHSKI